MPFDDRQEDEYGNKYDDDWTICVDDCGERERITSYLRGSVDVFVTSEDILMYIIIVCCCTPIGDLCYPFTRCLNYV